MAPGDKALIWLRGEVKTPPFTKSGRSEAGMLLRQLQRGRLLSMPQSRPMPSVGPKCHELRVRDEGHYWRILYRVDHDAILVIDVFAKRTRATPDHVLAAARRRLQIYDDARRG